MGDEPPRHSHGLSWSSTTRDSVVDNLLFSFDNISRNNVAEHGEEDDAERHQLLRSLTSQFHPPVKVPMAAITTRARGHTHSSSDSEYARRIDSPASSKSFVTAKGRRSNSSSNFGHLGHTLTSRTKSNNGVGRKSTDTASTAKQHQSEHNSAEATYGYGATLDTSRLAWGESRSGSTDQLHSGSDDSPSILERGRPVPSVHSRYEAGVDTEAAPEPVIAAGPRKALNPHSSGPVYVDAANSKQQKPSTLRKITTQTDLRSAGTTPSPPIPIPDDIRIQAADFVRTSSMRGGITGQPPPSAQSNAAPGPGIARRKDPSPPREKQGFFKRVFGGGSSRAVSTNVERPSSNQAAQPSNDRLNAPIRSTSQTSAGSHPKGDVQQTPTVTTTAPPQMLNKKPSSFFRRRKKSTSGSFQPPLPSDANSNFPISNAQAAQLSPSISSLRKVMDPYLSRHDSRELTVPSQLKDQVSRPTTGEDSEDPDIFHTGYTPPLDASLGPQNSTSQPDSPSSKMKVKKRRPHALPTSNDQEYPRPDTSTITLRDHATEHPKVSPISAVDPISMAKKDREPSSRPSTGDRIINSKESSPVEPIEDLRDFSAGTNVSLDLNEDGWYVKPHQVPERPPSKKSDRLILRPSSSEEHLGRDNDLSTIDGSTRSPEFSSDSSAPNSAPLQQPVNGSEPAVSAARTNLLLPTVTVDSIGNLSHKSSDPTIVRVPSPLVDDGAEYRERARRIFQGDEEDVPKADAASWLGEKNTLSTKTLQAFMQLFDFAGLNALAALRTLCSKLILKGETQQFDRIITTLSARWCECNPRHGFKAQDVVHTIFYSIILLNTDLHLADIEEKMSKSAYVKNTLPTIRRVVQDAAPGAFNSTAKPSPHQLRPSIPRSEYNNPSVPSSPALATPKTPDPMADRMDSSPSHDAAQASAMNNNTLKRLSIRPGAPARNDSDSGVPESAASNALVNNSWNGTLRGWEMEIEAILKSFFTAIRNQPLPLLGVPSYDPNTNRNLSVADLNGNGLKRTGSIVSKAPSDNMSYRSAQKDSRSSMRWPGRANRSRPKLYPASTVGSSRTSFDDGSGFWSPAQSSKYSFSKTLTSASLGSFSNLSAIDNFKHSIGFANALSQAIIREETSGGETESFSVAPGLLEDESLALEGAPWAKEGLVKHKHHLNAPDKKAKERNWNDCFAVISKGKLTLFAFNTSGKSQSVGRKAPFGRSGKAASVTSTRVGGGDWMENAEQLDVFVLRQTIASTLPPPGYSKARPHVWALSLPSGAVHLFQVGTPEIAVEFMTTANYWSARLSKEPLAGGVSNIEYGWSDNVIDPALMQRSETTNPPPPSMTNRGHNHSTSTDWNGRPSLQSSLRTSFDTGFGSGAKTRLPGDKVMIHDWQPPSQSMMASQLMEVDQLKQLTAYVQGSEEELARHNELKHGIEVVVSRLIPGVSNNHFC